ncbi:MAG: DUF805 domain-containing protein [Pseudomonadota bacterium]
MTTWHVYINGATQGPFSDEQVKALAEAGTINAATMAWRSGMNDWAALDQTDYAFKAALRPPPIAQRPPPVAAAASSVPAMQAAPGQHDPLSPWPAGQTYAVQDAPGAPAADQHLSMWGFFTRAMTTFYAKFTGRARRKEYWSFTLFWILGLIIAMVGGLVIDAAAGNLPEPGRQAKTAPVATIAALVIYYVATFIPGLAITIRRIHDLGLSGWLYLIILIPYLGGLILLVMTVLPTEKVVNKHGAPHVST